jgi:type IV secretory pathway TraG/TraD family ATPase VirD4
MWEFQGDMRLVAAAYYAGDRWVRKKQLSYGNPDVVAYVESVRRHYLQRMSSAASLPGDQDLILLVSLNTNANERAVEALGKIILQNVRLMVGKRYSREPEPGHGMEPMVSVILDEFEAFAYPGFANVLQTARGARISILFSFQMLSQLEKVSKAFAEEVSSAPQTKMIMNVSEETTVQWFLKASARVATKRRSLAVRKTGVFSTKYVETGTGSESEIKETRAREDQIKNLPTGQMQILMVDSLEGTKYSHR